jgi:hypothetical protein
MKRLIKVESVIIFTPQKLCKIIITPKYVKEKAFFSQAYGFNISSDLYGAKRSIASSLLPRSVVKNG